MCSFKIRRYDRCNQNNILCAPLSRRDSFLARLLESVFFRKKERRMLGKGRKKAIHQQQGGIMCPTVDVCNSLQLLLPHPSLCCRRCSGSLLDDNRWRALITSSQRKMNSYPASSRGIFTVEGERERERRGRQSPKCSSAGF